MSSILAQFGHPQGMRGWLVGHLMAVKNGARSRWTLSELRAQPGERVLEVGFGPGVDVRRLLRCVGEEGHVAGVDVSAEMVRQARARNRAAARAGRADLRQGSVGALPFAELSFDAAYSVNSAFFWPDLEAGLREIRRVLRDGGRALVAVQPMWKGATETDAERWSERLASAMGEAGFAKVETLRRALRPSTAVAALGKR
jgi:ubiquinone/menaquinone biosynthesis C-methylase UbiE